MKLRASKETSPKDPEKIREEKAKRKRFLISFLIAFITTAVLTGLVILIEYYSLGPNKFETYKYLYLVDGFALSGIISLMVFLLSYPASQGSFDILAYGIQIAFLTIFRPNYRKTSFPADFHEYALLKKQEQRKPLLALFYVSLIFIAVGLLMLIPYYQHL